MPPEPLCLSSMSNALASFTARTGWNARTITDDIVIGMYLDGSFSNPILGINMVLYAMIDSHHMERLYRRCKTPLGIF